MPAKLIAALDTETAALRARRLGRPDDATESAIQEQVWSTRATVPARLTGGR